MTPVVVERSRQSLFESDLRLPLQHRSGSSISRKVIADVDSFSLLRIIDHTELAGAIDANQHRSKVLESDDGLASDVEDLSVHRLHRREQECVDCVVYECEIPALVAVP